MSKILFLYATREGQTRKICESMADVCREEGLSAEVYSLFDPHASEALMQSTHIVIGASIHYGHFPLDLYQFIAGNRPQLEMRHNAFFGVNLTARKPGKDTPQGSAYIRKFLKTSLWQPQRVAVFAGALLYSRYTWYDRMMIRFIMWLTGGPTDISQDIEFTDWDRVRATAREWMR